MITFSTYLLDNVGIGFRNFYLLGEYSSES